VQEISLILNKAAKTSTSLEPGAEDPYDLPKPRDRIESDYDLLPARKEPVRTFSEDDYDELPARKHSEKETKQPHFSQNNNTEDDDDYDELPSRSVKQPEATERQEAEEDDYDELPVRKPSDNDYDIPKAHEKWSK